MFVVPCGTFAACSWLVVVLFHFRCLTSISVHHTIRIQYQATMLLIACTGWRQAHRSSAGPELFHISGRSCNCCCQSRTILAFGWCLGFDVIHTTQLEVIHVASRRQPPAPHSDINFSRRSPGYLYKYKGEMVHWCKPS